MINLQINTSKNKNSAPTNYEINFIKRTTENYTHEEISDKKIKSITSWRKSQKKFLSALILNILTCGILHLVSKCYPKLYLKLYCNICSPKNSDFFLVEDIYGKLVICQTKKEKNILSIKDFQKMDLLSKSYMCLFPSWNSKNANINIANDNTQNNRNDQFINNNNNPIIRFVYNSRIYEYDEERQAVVPVYLNLSGKTNKNIIDIFNEGLSSQFLSKKIEERFGKNEYKLNIDLISVYFIKIERKLIIYSVFCGCLEIFGKDFFSTALLLSIIAIYYFSRRIMRYKLLKPYSKSDLTIDGEKSYRPKVKRKYLFKKNNETTKRKSIKDLDKLEFLNQDRKSISNNIYINNIYDKIIDEKKDDGYKNYEYAEINNSELLPGDIIFLKEGDYCPCDGIILEDSCIVNEIELNEKIEYSFKSFLKYSNDVFDYKTNVRNIILHGMKIVKIFKKYNKNKVFLTVLCINTGFNTFKANQLTNITKFFERKNKYNKMYKMLAGERLCFFISVLIIFLLSITITTAIFALKIKEKGLLYILSDETSIDDISFNPFKFPNSTINKNKNIKELESFSKTEEGKKAFIKLIITKYLFLYFLRLIIKCFMPIYFVILSIILLKFMHNLYKVNILCYEKMRLHYAAAINTVFMSKIGVLSDSKYEIEGYHSAYQSPKTSAISIQTYYEDQLKDFGNIILSYYSNINSKNENSLDLDTSNKAPNKYSVWFLECLLCCNNIIKIGQYIKGDVIEIKFFDKMKWELKIPDDNDLSDHEKYIYIVPKNNNNSDCLSQNSKGENNNIKDKPTYHGSDKEEKYIYNRIIDLFPQNYYRMKDKRNLAYQKLVSGFKFYLSNKILKRKSRANTVSVININNNKIISDSMKNNPILKDLSNFKCGSYKLRIYKKFITRHSLFSSAIVYNFLLKTLRFMTKGSPEKILPHCIMSSLPDDIYKTISNYRKDGYIIIVCASKKLDLYSYVDINDENHYLKDLTFCGFISLKNKLNKDSKKAIKELTNMGCEIIMSTGDNALNSIGTGFEAGLLDNNKKIFLFDLDETRKQIYINNIYRPTSFDYEIHERIEEKKKLFKKPKDTKKLRGTELFMSKRNKEDCSNHQIKSPIKPMNSHVINLKTNAINIPKLSKPINLRNKKNTLIKSNLFSRSNSKILLNEASNNNDSFYSSERAPALSNCPTTKTSDIDSKNNTSYLNNSNRSKTKTNNINNINNTTNKLINKKRNQRKNPNVSLENQYTFENSKKNLFYNSTIILDAESEEIEKEEFIKKYFYNICYFSISSLKELEKDCIFCVSGKAFQFIYKNKEHTQYSNLLNILLKNVKIFYSMTSQDKSFLIDYYRDLPNKITCMIGNETNDIDSIMTAHVGISIKKPSNANMILCHFYLPTKNLLSVKTLIEYSKAVVENNFLLYFSSLFCTTIIETFIGYSFIKSKDVEPGLLRIINIFFYFLSLFGFTNSVDNSSNNILKKNNHLFARYIIVHIIGNVIIKTYSIILFFYLYRGNSLIEESKRNNIFSSYFAILSMNLVFTTLFGFNFVRFYRNNIIENYMFIFTLIIFMMLILINTCLSKIGLSSFFTQYFAFENLKSKSDTFDDRNKLSMFGIIFLDLASSIIFILVTQYIFNKKAKNYIKKEN